MDRVNSSLTSQQHIEAAKQHLDRLEQAVKSIKGRLSETDEKTQAIIQEFKGLITSLKGCAFEKDPALLNRVQKIKKEIDAHLPTTKTKEIAGRLIIIGSPGTPIGLRKWQLEDQPLSNSFFDALALKAEKELKGEKPLVVQVDISKLVTAEKLFQLLENPKNKNLENRLLIALFDKVASDEMSVDELKSLQASMQRSTQFQGHRWTSSHNYEMIQKDILSAFLQRNQKNILETSLPSDTRISLELQKKINNSPINKLYTEFEYKKFKEFQAHMEKSRPFSHSKRVFPLFFIPNALKASLQNTFEKKTNNIALRGLAYLTHRVVTICSLATNLASLVLTGVLRVVATPFRILRGEMQMRVQNSWMELKKTITQDLTIEVRAFLGLFKKTKKKA